MVWMVVAAIYGAVAVFAGAFGAHGLKSILTPEQLVSWNTAAHYHLLHSVALLALGLYSVTTGRSVALPATLFAVGVLLFSGSIYGLLLTSQRWLGPVTPIGGVLMIAAWLTLIALARPAAER
jgi:uncharacterized membrane protein YgdD (TMEM256/DUF423 family)